MEGNNNRGFTLELVQDLVKEKNIDVSKPFLLITADNGINSLEEQKRIQTNFPNAFLIITDHHEPEKGMLIEENEKTIIFNPKYKASLYQTEEMKKEAVKSNGFAIEYIENPTEEMKLLAVKQNGWAIEYIKNPSAQVQLAAVKQNNFAIKYIENPTKEVKLEVAKKIDWLLI